tara:strand:- start:333 stop:524 length:192 start_codon:yes stop_codon:yes gene_type:complete
MPYLIIKKMNDPKTGKTTFTVLNNGMSEVMEIKEKKKAEKLVKVFNENSDSGWTYEVKEICEK